MHQMVLKTQNTEITFGRKVCVCVGVETGKMFVVNWHRKSPTYEITDEPL